MSNTLKFGNGQWATKKGSTLAYNDENGNFKPLPFTFDRSTSATRVNKQGLIEVVSNNEPRIDFLNDSNGALLLEPSRSNLNTYSEDIPQNYVSTEMSDTFGYSTSPNGLQTSTRLQLSNLGSSRYVHTLTGIVSSGTAYNFSCYYKGTQGETAYMYALPVGGTEIAKAITFTGEWQRENLNFTAGSSSNYVYIVDSRQGGDASDFEVWGAQLEQGSYATSYIPTQGSIGTRAAETCGDAGNDQVFNDSEGVLMAEISALDESGGNRELTLSDGSASNRIIVQYRDSSNIRIILAKSTGDEFDTGVIPFDTVSINKIAIKYKTNDFAFWVNGIEIYSDNSGNTFSDGTLSKINFDGGTGGNNFYGNTKQIKYFNKALSDAELQALTKI